MTRVFFVEDDPEFARILQKALAADPDIEIVHTSTNETDARHFITETELKNCDAVLLDLQLPVDAGDTSVKSLAGLQLLELMRQEYRYGGIIIVLTNSRAAADGERALSAGCDGYLCKRARAAEVPAMLVELKLALKGEVILIASQMRHVFMREDLSAKEAKLLDLLAAGKGWIEIAKELGYGNSKTAANIGDRLFDKLLTPAELERASKELMTKRELAIEVWRKRKTSTAQKSPARNGA